MQDTERIETLENRATVNEATLRLTVESQGVLVERVRRLEGMWSPSANPFYSNPSYLPWPERERLYLNEMNARLATEVQELRSKIIELERSTVVKPTRPWELHQHAGKATCQYHPGSGWIMYGPTNPVGYCPICGLKLESE